MTGLDIPATARRMRRRGHGGPAASPPISAVAADGWQATMIAPADLAFLPISVSRPGFDATGAAVTHGETLLTTKRVRQVYPNQALLTADKVALSDYVYSTDAIAGVANGSAEISPKPVANWSLPDRQVVGNALELRLVAFHRNGRAGKPVACVEFRASDGIATVTAKVSAMTATVDPVTGLTIAEYVGTLDITGLNPGLVTANAKVYPWIGGPASVLDSADLAARYQFSPRTYVKTAASPHYVYVASGGSDSTGAVSQIAATAAAAPCLTLTGAINRARAVVGSAAGSLNNLVIRLTAGTWTRAATPTANITDSCITIEPAPGVAKAACIFQFGASNHFASAYWRLRGLTIQRTGAQPIQNFAASLTVIEDCDLDGGSQNFAMLAGTGAHVFYNGVTMANMATTAPLGASAAHQPLFRGVVHAPAANNVMDGRLVLGCRIANTRRTCFQDPSGAVVAFNRFPSLNFSGNVVEALSFATATSGYALVQNVYEYTSAATSGVVAGLSNDGLLNPTAHVIAWHNTIAGFDTYGRSNLLYDEAAGTTRRAHRLHSFVGNIHVQVNTKSDIFAGASQGNADAPNRTGNWAYLHGVGVRGEFSRYRNAAGNLTSGFHQDYPGIGSIIGTTNAAPGNDPLFTDYRATGSGPAAGAGGGTYTLQVGSPARGMVADSPLGLDLSGSTRSGTAAAGAYA